MKLVLVDDHRLFREGLRALLSEHPGLDVVAEAADARSGYAAVSENHPDLALLDVGLPGLSGITAVRELKRRDSRLKVLMLTMHEDEQYAADAWCAGADGYAVKTQSHTELIEAIAALARGDRYLSPSISRDAVDELLRARSTRSIEGPFDLLSAREREVFELLVRGFTNGGIGAELGISIKTVETHRARILRKLGIHSVVELIRMAARHGLLEK